jgi:6-phosphogluconolactonase/glucosamine-6-phosphate isomerase/deaminase
MMQKNNMINVHTSSAPIDEAARTLSKKIKAHKGKDILLLFSGGSSLAIVDHMHPRILTKHCTVSVLDERYTFERDASNFAKLSHTEFFKYVEKKNIPYIDPQPHEGESLEEAGKRFDIALKHWHVTHNEGLVFATVGIGPDGHTAGVLPMKDDPETFSRLFQKNSHCAVGYTVRPEINPHTERITTTLTYLLRHLNYACIYATGSQKRGVLLDLLNTDIDFSVMPAQALKKIPEAQLFTDMTLE